ncbi:hypothetical protein QBC35DRAFT_538265 [Podospora australis]|uniref:Homocitrate synthase n=1 Tax=Podospora australis TaxID=1536484 RepID=A0AAN7ALP4_9PEZI|nr:hypothetical protein QBC35DRAFT_538265 [Podospora australis]
MTISADPKEPSQVRHRQADSNNTRSSPYEPVKDFISNVSRFKIIESTLREGEQFANAFFDTEMKIKIAKALDEFGVDYIELTSPAASDQSRQDCEAICKLGLKAKILTHVRCTMTDARIAVETGVDGLEAPIFLTLMQVNTGRGLEVRFSSEDSFRSDLVDLLSLYRAVDSAGVHRVGIADIVGCASPRQVYDLVKTLRGCRLLLARMIVADCDYVTKKYKLQKLKELEDLVAESVQVHTPFNNPITGFCASTHKAGIHAKAILNNPSTYEIIDPADFGMTRYVYCASRLTGWNAIKVRVEQLGLTMADDQVKEVTRKIKPMAGIRPISIDDTDSIIRTFHLGLGSRGDEANKELSTNKETESKDTILSGGPFP